MSFLPVRPASNTPAAGRTCCPIPSHGGVLYADPWGFDWVVWRRSRELVVVPYAGRSSLTGTSPDPSSMRPRTGTIVQVGEVRPLNASVRRTWACVCPGVTWSGLTSEVAGAFPQAALDPTDREPRHRQPAPAPVGRGPCQWRAEREAGPTPCHPAGRHPGDTVVAVQAEQQ